MSNTTSPTSKTFSSPTSTNPAKRPEMAVRRPSQTNYVDAQRAAAAQSHPPVEMPDGRRNSQGEVLKSPVASWTPTFERKQSWNQQDLKREVQSGQLDRAKETAGYSET